MTDKDYYRLYKEVLEENKKLRERITYPKIIINSQHQCFDKKAMWADILLGDGFTRQREFQEYDCFICQKYNDFEDSIKESLLRNLGYKYVKRAYDYWKAKEPQQELERH